MTHTYVVIVGRTFPDAGDSGLFGPFLTYAEALEFTESAHDIDDGSVHLTSGDIELGVEILSVNGISR